MAGGRSIQEATDFEEPVVVWRGAVQRDVGEHLADHRAELETMTAESSANHYVLVFRMGIDDEVLVRRLRIEADSAFARRRCR